MLIAYSTPGRGPRKKIWVLHRQGALGKSSAWQVGYTRQKTYRRCELDILGESGLANIKCYFLPELIAAKWLKQNVAYGSMSAAEL